jgi:hypothetical protein
VPFLDRNLRFGDNQYMERGGVGVGSPFSGCLKSETGKNRPSAKIDGTRSRALRGATGVKSGVKSGGFWQLLSQDVALCSRKSSSLDFIPLVGPRASVLSRSG